MKLMCNTPHRSDNTERTEPKTETPGVQITLNDISTETYLHLGCKCNSRVTVLKKDTWQPTFISTV